MRKLKRILWGAVIALVILVITSVIVAVVFLDGIAKKGVETLGPEITKVSVKLEGVHLSLLTGSAGVKGLVIGNPEGYKTPQAINVGLATVGVNSLSVLSDKIVVRSVRVEAPEITFEGNPFGKNNLRQIMDNIDAGVKSGGAAATNAPAQAGKKSAKTFEVDDFLITGGKVHVSLTGMSGKEMTLPLPEIHLTDLGKDANGITAADLAQRVFGAITSSTLKVVTSAISGIGKGAENVGKDAGKAVGEGVNKITKGIGNLLGK